MTTKRYTFDGTLIFFLLFHGESSRRVERVESSLWKHFIRLFDKSNIDYPIERLLFYFRSSFLYPSLYVLHLKFATISIRFLNRSQLQRVHAFSVGPMYKYIKLTYIAHSDKSNVHVGLPDIYVLSRHAMFMCFAKDF